MPEEYENPVVYQFQLDGQELIRQARAYAAAKQRVVDLKARRDALIAQDPTLKSEGKALAASIRALCSVPSGDVDFASAIAVAPTWRTTPNAAADTALEKLNQAIAYFEGL